MEKGGGFVKTEIRYAFAILACSIFGLGAWEVISIVYPWTWADAEAERVASIVGVDSDSFRKEITHSFARGIAGLRASVRVFWGIAILLQLALFGHLWFYSGNRPEQKPS